MNKGALQQIVTPDNYDLVFAPQSQDRAILLPEEAALTSSRAQPDAFYLTFSVSLRDLNAVASLAMKKGDGFFYPPLSVPVKNGTATGFEVASRVLLGNAEKPVYTMIIRWARSDRFLGCVRLFDIQPGASAKIGYFFDPLFHKIGVGTQAVLRAIEHVVTEGISRDGLDIKQLEATADPKNMPSIRILYKMGLNFTRYVSCAETPYEGANGKPRPRALLKGDILEDVLPALTKAKAFGIYSGSTQVVCRQGLGSQ